MIKWPALVVLVLDCLLGYAQLTPFEQDKSRNRTTTYHEMASFYQQLAGRYEQCRLFTYDSTEAGRPLQLLVLSKDRMFDVATIKSQGRAILFLNNGIHPGEPEGIDASMMFARDLLKKDQLPQNVVICIIPAYNLGGMLNRGKSRINQNGPDTYGFRGDPLNYDLNRDFIKTDTKSSYIFQQLFNQWDPDVLLDAHSSNGADYQYSMTLIDSQKDKMNPTLAAYSLKNFTSALYTRMEKSGYDMTPYVSSLGETPASGIQVFLETPRFSTGYATLHHCIAYMTETHMLKPYKQRVESTYIFMHHLLNLCNEQREALIHIRARVREEVSRQSTFALNWELDTLHYQLFAFKGFEGLHKPSDIGDHERLYYDRSKPYTRNIHLYDTYKASISIRKPKAYVIPQAYNKVIDLLRLNGISLHRIRRDTLIRATMYYITGFKTAITPFEGHYLHSNVELNPSVQDVHYYAGDCIVQVNQPGNRFIVETLEPQGVDSYFTWNFFDAILDQKEHFSPYIFEDQAARLLKEHPALAVEFEKAKQANPNLSRNGRAGLNWVYEHSEYYEKTHNRYPIARIE